MNPLQFLFQNGVNGTANTTPMFSTRTLPNGGGSYNLFNPVVAPAPVAPPAPVFSGAPAKTTVATPITRTPTASAPAAAPLPVVDLYAKYRDPKTGDIMTPEQYAIFLGNRVPAQKGNGDISQYAGNAITSPKQSVTSLESTARNLNNARNDIATGTTDPYGVGATSGIPYSPTELAAIRNAYAGIYDPALNDVFTRLKDQKAADDAEIKRQQDLADSKQKTADQIFATNESIRQWKATTGTGPTYNGGAGTKFTKTQLNNGAMNAGMTIESFSVLDDDLKNFFIQNPKALDDNNKAVPVSTNLKNDIEAVKNGTMTIKEVTDNIMSSNLSETVKHYFIDQLPLTDVQKQGFFSKIWGAVTGIWGAVTGLFPGQ